MLNIQLPQQTTSLFYNAQFDKVESPALDGFEIRVYIDTQQNPIGISAFKTDCPSHFCCLAESHFKSTYNDILKENIITFKKKLEVLKNSYHGNQRMMSAKFYLRIWLDSFITA